MVRRTTGTCFGHVQSPGSTLGRGPESSSPGRRVTDTYDPTRHRRTSVSHVPGTPPLGPRPSTSGGRKVPVVHPPGLHVALRRRVDTVVQAVVCHQGAVPDLGGLVDQDVPLNERQELSREEGPVRPVQSRHPLDLWSPVPYPTTDVRTSSASLFVVPVPGE